MVKHCYVYKAVITRIIDGDTVDAQIDLGFHTFINHRVRLNGINTPELNSSIFSVREAANKAKERLSELVSKQKLVLLETSKSDLYGRFLGTIYLIDDVGEVVSNINQILLNEGFAVIYDGKTKVG